MKKQLSIKLSRYAAMAGSAAFATSAQAEIVYTDIPDQTFSNSGQFYDLDLNNDGIPDFKLTLTKSQGSSTFTTYYGGTSNFAFVMNLIDIEPAGNNEVQITGGYYSNFAKALNINAPINQQANWGGNLTNLGAYTFFSFSGFTFNSSMGSWGNQTNKYLGLKLLVSGKTYYGWFRLDVANKYASFTIKDYAYQDYSGIMIKAGDPGNIPADQALNVNAVDVADIGSASDMQISFTKAANESTISEYRVMIVKASQAGNFNIAAAKNVALPNYIQHTPNGSNFLFNPASNQKDVDGDAIQQNVPYKVFVLSFPNGNTSTSVALAQQANTVTLTMGNSVAELSNKGIGLRYTDKMLYIDCTNPELQGKEMQVLSLNGQVIYSALLTNGVSTHNLQTAANGIYLLKFSDPTLPAVKIALR